MKKISERMLSFVLVTVCFVSSAIASENLQSDTKLSDIAANLLQNNASRKEIDNSFAVISSSSHQEMTLDKFDELYQKSPATRSFLDRYDYLDAALEFYNSVSYPVYKTESTIHLSDADWRITEPGLGQYELRIGSTTVDFNLEELSVDDNVSTRKEIRLWLPDNGGYEDIKYDDYYRLPEMTSAEGLKLLQGKYIRPIIYYQLMPQKFDVNKKYDSLIGFFDNIRLNYALLKQSYYLEGRVLGIEFDGRFIYLASKKTAFPF